MYKKIGLTAFVIACCVVCCMLLTPVGEQAKQSDSIIANEVSGNVATENVQQTRVQDLPKAENIFEEEEGEAYVADQVVVSFENLALQDGQLTQAAKKILSNCKTVADYDSQVKQINDKQCVISVSQEASVSQAVAELNGIDGIEYADADWIFALPDTTSTEDVAQTSANLTNDPYVSNQWALTSSWQTVGAAWTQAKANKTVSVATLDTGIQTDHSDLKNNILYSGYVPLDGYGAEDRNGHGTHVAGIVAAESDNGIGVSGVSYNAGIVSVRVFRQIMGNWSAYSSDIALGVENVISMKDTYNIRVINMSLGMTGTSRSTPPASSSLMQSAIKKAYDTGITVCVASGNESSSTSLATCNFPAYFDFCIAVGSIDSTKEHSLFSNGDNSLDIVAPGRSILSTVRNNAYSTMNGTSMATPFVSGIAALCYVVNPSITPAQVYSALTKTAVDLGDAGFDNFYGYGLVDPNSALTYAKAGSAVENHKLNVSVQGDVSGTISLTDDSGTAYESGSSVENGKYLILNWSGIQNDTTDGSLIMITSVTKNGTSIYSASDVSKTSWSATNTYWRSVYGIGQTYVTYDTVNYALSKGGEISIGHIDEETNLIVTYTKLQPIYRLYNSLTSEHLFTTSKSEYDNFANLCTQKQDAWIPEGIDWFAYSAESTETSPVYRLYNSSLGSMGKNSHYYTSDKAEADRLVQDSGWTYDSFNGNTTCYLAGGSIGIYTCYNEALGSAHHYTSSKTEWEGLSKHGWDLEQSKNNNGTGFFKAVLSAK